MRYLFLVIAVIPFLLAAQPKESKSALDGYFGLPLDRTIYLSGTFGELRPSHFHAGIDIKSINGRPGEKILSSAGGYVARIKVSPYGYGNALYIAHPNGYTTVYAHLDRFIPDIAEYVKQKQYELKRFAVDLYPRADQFRVSKGGHIGYLGNSGGSYGPHLHFEIRRTSDQVPINPLLHGIPINDSRKPVIDGIMIYYLNSNNEPIYSIQYDPIEVSPGKYTLSDTLIEGAWRIGIGISTTDRMDQVSNKNGVYSLQLSVDDSHQFGFRMQELSFSRTRYLNAHIDYAARVETRKYFNLCFPQPGNKLTIYDKENESGVIELFAGKSRTIKISVKDAAQNESEINFVALRDTVMYSPPSETPKYSAAPDKRLEVKEPGFDFDMPAGSVYRSIPIEFSARDTTIDFPVTIFRIGSESIPMHKYAELSLSVADIPVTLHDKTAIGYLNETEADREIVSLGGTVTNSRISAATRSMGSFCLVIDTVPPTITPVEFSSDMKTSKRMRFTIEDNLPTSGKASGLSYTGSCDGKWILFEYDAKRDMLTHWFDERIAPGNHELVLKVSDDRGNMQVFKHEFTR